MANKQKVWFGKKGNASMVTVGDLETLQKKFSSELTITMGREDQVVIHCDNNLMDPFFSKFMEKNAPAIRARNMNLACL